MSHTTAVLQALLVTFIWSLSWVLIKVGVQDIPALIFAGLRYSLAALCLLGLVLSRPEQRQQVPRLSAAQWLSLALLGVVFYAVTQGAQFLGLVYLPAVTLSLMLNFTVALVALSGVLIGEYPNRAQWLGIGLFIVGALVYLNPQTVPSGIGLLIGGVGMVANAASSILGRSINRSQQLSPLLVTTISMSIGSLVLLAAGLLTEGVPVISATSWLIVVWLAVVHTAFAFTLWNLTLRHLKAFESSLINNTMLIQIAVLALLFLGETISPSGALGLACATAGILFVQFGKPRAD